MCRFTTRELVLLTLLVAMVADGVARERPNDSPTIVVAGTREYSRTTKEWAIAPEKAERIVAHKKRRDGSNLNYRHRFIVENYYAFVVPKHKRGTAISGYYVDGSSGEVMWLSAEDFQVKFGPKYKKGFIPSREMEAIRENNDRPAQ